MPSPSADTHASAPPSRANAVLQRALRLLPALLLPPLAAAVTVAVHLRWLARDASLPVGDAAGHLVNVARHMRWLAGESLPAESFPPGLYVVAGWMARRLGTDVDDVLTGTVVFAGLLALVASWAGVRAAGLVAGVALPLAALATPHLSAAAREVLLDLPMTAMVVSVWVFAWASDGYRRAVPTLLTGAALGLGALVKYTLFPWVLPALVLPGLVMAARSPASLLPLALVIWPAWYAAQTIIRRAGDPSGSVLRVAVLDPLQAGQAWAAGGALVVIAAVAVARWRGRDGRHLRGLAAGAWLALAALLSIALVAPWFLHAMPVVWEKVHREAVAEVRTSGLENSLEYARVMLLRSWPAGWWLLQGALALEAAWLGWVALAWVRRGPLPGPVGPAPAIVASCALGTWFTANNLPVDPRYYLPLLAGGALVVGLGACRFRLGRWVLGPALVALLGHQVLVSEGYIAGEKLTRHPLAGFEARRAWAADLWGPFGPPAPAPAPLLVAIDQAVTVVTQASKSRTCRTVIAALPRFAEGRSLGIEPVTLAGLGAVRGGPECAWELWEQGTPAPAAPSARLVMVAGLPPLAAELAEAAAGAGGEALFEAQVAGRVVRVRAREAPAVP